MYPSNRVRGLCPPHPPAFLNFVTLIGQVNGKNTSLQKSASSGSYIRALSVVAEMDVLHNQYLGYGRVLPSNEWSASEEDPSGFAFILVGVWISIFYDPPRLPPSAWAAWRVCVAAACWCSLPASAPSCCPPSG